MGAGPTMENQEVITENKPVDQKKKHKPLRIIGNIFFWLIVVVVGTTFMVQGIDRATGYQFPFFGYRQLVITSESMSLANEENTYLTEDMHRIDMYDVIITKDYGSYEDIQMYDVLTYMSGDSIICHRVVNLYEENNVKYIITRGDSNNIDDVPFTFSEVRGKVVSVTPGMGRFILFIQSPYFLVGFCFSVFFVLLGLFIYDWDKGKKQKQIATNEKEKEETQDNPNNQ